MKISFLEAILIFVGLMWVFGYFRKLAQSAERNNSPNTNTSPQGNNSTATSHQPKQHYGDNDSEYVDYEEVK